MFLKNIIYLWLAAAWFFLPKIALGQSYSDLKGQIEDYQGKIKKIESQIKVYEKNIATKQKEALTVRNQLSVLGSQIEKTSLDLLLTQAKISELELNIKSLEEGISLKEKKIAEQKVFLGEMISTLARHQKKNYLEVILISHSFADYFDDLRYLKDISSKINQSLKDIRQNRDELSQKKLAVDERLSYIEEFKKQLKQRQDDLEEQKEVKNFLLKETQSSEIKFKLLLEQLRDEDDALNQEAIRLQRELEKKLGGVAGGALTWPFDANNSLSTQFHDPTYPFRYLFEHSGIDIRAQQGTPVKASGPGYVAWVKSSRFYGNNILIVHANNLVTLYAHLSKFNIKADAFVERGQIIGWSGGMPGVPGAGFSSGPHLHFEVRANGIPQDPLQYLKL